MPCKTEHGQIHGATVVIRKDRETYHRAQVGCAVRVLYAATTIRGGWSVWGPKK